MNDDLYDLPENPNAYMHRIKDELIALLERKADVVALREDNVDTWLGRLSIAADLTEGFLKVLGMAHEYRRAYADADGRVDPAEINRLIQRIEQAGASLPVMIRTCRDGIAGHT